MNLINKWLSFRARFWGDSKATARKLSILTLASVPLLGFGIEPARAIAIGTDFLGNYTFTDLGSVSGLPPSYGGIVFKDGDPNTVLIGGAANTANGLYYEAPVIRDGSQSITGFGAITPFGTVGEYNDGGIAYGPGGVLFTAQWNQNKLGQTKPGSSDEDKIIDLAPLGLTTSSSISGLNFVPSGFSGAGNFKVVDWSGGNWYDVVLSPDGFGTYNIDSFTLEANLIGGPEGFVFIDDAGNPGFNVDSLLITEWSAGNIAAYDLDANGDPIVGTRRDFITGLTGAEGAAIDPLTGDFLFSTFGGGDRVIRVDGFVPPPTGGVPEPSIIALFAAGLFGIGFARRKLRS